MHRLLMFVLLVVASLVDSSAQSYFPIPTDSVMWRSTAWNDGGNPRIIGRDQIETFGDTIIGNTKCTKLGGIWSHDSSYYYVGCFYEDSTRKVFYLPRDSMNFQLLYDFSLNVGDTITKLYQLENDTLFVHSIDTLAPSKQPLPGLNARIFRLHSVKYGDFIHGANWHQGIGSEDGFLSATYQERFESAVVLDCFQIKGVPYVFKNFCGPLGIDNPNFKQISINLQNPIVGQTQVKIEGVKNTTQRVSLHSLTGKTVANYHLDNDFFIIDGDAHPSGIYLLRILDSSGLLLSKKVVIQ